MATSDGILRPLSKSRARQVVTWILFFLVTFSLGGYKVWQNYRDAEAQADWQARMKRLQAAAPVHFSQLQDHARKLLGKPGSQRQLQIDWNSDIPFELRKEGDHEVCDWEDPKYRCYFKLSFKDGRLQGWNASWAAGLAKLNPQPYRFATFGKAEAWRRQIAILTPFVWFFLFVAWWLSVKHRLLLSQVLLATVFVNGTAHLVNPNYGLTLKSIFSNDHLGISVLMLIVTVELLAAALIATKASARSFLPLRFGLRRLLGAMTVIACLLAMGPVGYLLLFMGIVCSALFVATYEFARIQAHPRL